MGNLTTKGIQGLKGTGRSYRVRDRDRSGLAVQVSAKGTKTLVMVYRDREGGKERVLRLGAYPTVSLKEARAAVNVYREWLADGIDPKAELERQRGEREHREREEKRRRQEEEALGTVANLFDSYVARMEAMGRRSAAEVRYSLNRDALPLLGPTTHAKDIGPNEIVSVLRRVVERGALVYANRLRSYLHAAFAFGFQVDHDPAHTGDVRFAIPQNPVAGVGQTTAAREGRRANIDG